jgi:hypothetical protein
MMYDNVSRSNTCRIFSARQEPERKLKEKWSLQVVSPSSTALTSANAAKKKFAASKGLETAIVLVTQSA